MHSDGALKSLSDRLHKLSHVSHCHVVWLREKESIYLCNTIHKLKPTVQDVQRSKGMSRVWISDRRATKRKAFWQLN